MQAKYLILKDGWEKKTLKNIDKLSSRAFGSLLLKALVAETVDSGDFADFIVAAQNCLSVPVFKLKSKDKTEALHRVIALIDLVSQK